MARRRFEERIERETGIEVPKPTGPGTTPPVKAEPIGGFYGILFKNPKHIEKPAPREEATRTAVDKELVGYGSQR